MYGKKYIYDLCFGAKILIGIYEVLPLFNMKINRPILTVTVALIVSSFYNVLAIPRPSTPQCHVKGIIDTIEFSPGYKDPCLDTPGKCPEGSVHTYPDITVLSVNVKETKYIGDYAVLSSCEKLYPINQLTKISVESPENKPRPLFMRGLQIEGDIKSNGMPFFSNFSIAITPVFLNYSKGLFISLIFLFILTLMLFLMSLYKTLKHPLVNKKQ